MVVEHTVVVVLSHSVVIVVCNVPPERKMNLWSALLMFCPSATRIWQDGLYTKPQELVELDLLISDRLIFTS